MAQVTATSRIQGAIDDYLDYFTAEWRGVPALAAEWPDWDEDEQLDFILEWPIREDRLEQLRSWAGEGLLMPAQRERYAALLQLVARHRPTIEELFAD